MNFDIVLLLRKDVPRLIALGKLDAGQLDAGAPASQTRIKALLFDDPAQLAAEALKLISKQPDLVIGVVKSDGEIERVKEPGNADVFKESA